MVKSLSRKKQYLDDFNSTSATLSSEMKVNIPHHVCISDNNGLSTVGNISTNELYHLANVDKDIQEQLNNLKNIVIHSCNEVIDQNTKWSQTVQNEISMASNYISKEISELTLDDINDSYSRKCITDGYYNSDLTVESYIVNVQNLNKVGVPTIISSDHILSSNLYLASSSLDNAALKLSHDNPSKSHPDCVSVDKYTSNLFNVKKTGKVGINKSNPTERLDIVGDIKFSGSINEVTATEMNYISGCTFPIQSEIDSNTERLDQLESELDNYLSSLKYPITVALDNELTICSNYVDGVRKNVLDYTENIRTQFSEKQDTIIFSDSFKNENDVISINSNLSFWEKDTDGSLTYDDYITFYSDRILKNTFTLDTAIVEYYGSLTAGNLSGVVKSTPASDFTYYWSSGYAVTNDGIKFENYQYVLNSPLNDGNGTLDYIGTNNLVDGYNGETIVIKVKYPFLLTQLKIFNHSNISVAGFKVYGSHDNVTWTQLDHKTSGGWQSASVYSNDISATNTIAYKYIGVCINKLNCISGTNPEWRSPFIYNVYLIGKKSIKTSEKYLLTSQFDAKEDIITGGASSIVSNLLNGGKLLASDANGKVIALSYDKKVLETIIDVSSDLQLQIDTKHNKISNERSVFSSKVDKMRMDTCNYTAVTKLPSVDGFQNKIINVVGDGLNFDGQNISFTGVLQSVNTTPVNKWKLENVSSLDKYISFSNISVYNDKITIKKKIDYDQTPVIIDNDVYVTSNIVNSVVDVNSKNLYYFKNTNRNSIKFPYDTIVDILIVGGGGVGGDDIGGGGGGGNVAIAYNMSIPANKEMNIIVGQGGGSSMYYRNNNVVLTDYPILPGTNTWLANYSELAITYANNPTFKTKASSTHYNNGTYTIANLYDADVGSWGYIGGELYTTGGIYTRTLKTDYGGEWLLFDTGVYKNLDMLKVYPPASSPEYCRPGRQMKKFKIWASNDDSAYNNINSVYWVPITADILNTDSSSSQKTFNILSYVPYRYYLLVVNEIFAPEIVFALEKIVLVLGDYDKKLSTYDGGYSSAFGITAMGGGSGGSFKYPVGKNKGTGGGGGIGYINTRLTSEYYSCGIGGSNLELNTDDYLLKHTITNYNGYSGSDGLLLITNTTAKLFPELVMTTNTTRVSELVIISNASTNSVSCEAYKAFDNNTSTSWSSIEASYTPETGIATTSYVTGYNGEWLMIDCGKEFILSTFKLHPITGSEYKRPSDFRVYGTNDINAFNTASHIAWGLIYEGGEDISYSLSASGASTHSITKSLLPYRYYMIVVNKIFVNGILSTSVNISSWELYGYDSNMYQYAGGGGGGVGSVATTANVTTLVSLGGNGIQTDIGGSTVFGKGGIGGISSKYDNDLYLYLKFDGNSVDSSENNLVITPAVSSTFDRTIAKYEQSMYFDGTSQYLTIPPTNFGLFDGITFSTWVYFTENRAFERVFDFGIGMTSDSIGITRENNTNHLKLFMLNVSTTAYIYNNVIVNNTWMHICWTVQKSPVVWQMYINGILKTPSSVVNPAILPNNIILQNCYIGKSAYVNPLFKGYMDDFRIYKRAITAAEVTKVYNGQSLVANGADGIVNTGSGGGGGNKGGKGGMGGDGVVVVRWKYDTSKEERLITNTDLELKQDLLTFSSDFVLDVDNNLSLKTGLNWFDNKQYISYKNVRIYDDKITIGSQSNSLFLNNTMDMIAWYKFNGDFNDSSGNGYHSTAYGTPVFISPNIVSFTTSGNHSQYISIPIDTIKSNGVTRQELTFSFWINKTQSFTTNYANYFSIDSEPSNQASIGDTIYFGQSPNNSNEIHFRYGLSYVNITTIYDNRATNIWNYYVLIIKKDGNNANIKIYMNGTKYTAYASTPWIELGSYLKINRWIQNQQLDNVGKQIKDFRIYNRVLTENEINIIFNNNVFGELQTNSVYTNSIIPYSSDTIKIGNKIEVSDNSYISNTNIIEDNRVIVPVSATAQDVTTANTINTLRTIDDEYKYSMFTTNGSITFNRSLVCDILIVGGGGSGGVNLGGGSSGGLLYATNQTIPSGSYPITVGAGGVNGNGGNSIAFGATAYGGLQATSATGATKLSDNLPGSTITVWDKNSGALAGGGPGNITYSYYAFTTNGSITFSNTTVCDILIVGGGGSGNTGKGGGSSGGLLYAIGQNISPGTAYPITVGAGGVNGDGGNSTAFGATAYGGLKATTATGATNNGANTTGSIITSWDINKIALDGGTTDPFFTDTTNLELWHKFDSDLTDSSTKSRDATAGTSSWDTTNKKSGAASILFPANGTGLITLNSAIHPYNIWNNSTSGITFSIWFRYVPHTTGTGLWGRLFDFESTTGSSSGFFISVKTNPNSELKGLYFQSNTGVFTYSDHGTEAGKPLDGNWHHIVWKIDKSGVWTIYYDGNNLNCGITNSPLSISTYSVRYLSKSAYSHDVSFSGNIDDFRIYNNTLTSTEINNLYNGFTIPGGGGGTGSAGVSATSLTSTPNGGDGFPVSIRTANEYFAGGGGANGGTRVPASGYTIGYGGNSSSSVGENGGSGIVIVRVLTSEVSSITATVAPALINVNSDTVRNNLRVWYKFSGTNGVTDSSVNSNNAIATGTPTISNNIISITQNNYLTVPSNIIDFANDITISFWYRFNNGYNYSRLFDFATATNVMSQSNSIKVTRAVLTSSLTFIIDTIELNVDFGHSTPGNLVHVTWVIKKDATWIIYKNGVRVYSATKVYPVTNTYIHSYLGKSNWVNDFNVDNQVSLKDFRVYNRTLTSDDIAKIYYTTDSTSFTSVIKYTDVRKYPPALISDGTSGTLTAAKTLTGQSYGNGEYIINWSSQYNVTEEHFKLLFNMITLTGGGGASALLTYNSTTVDANNPQGSYKNASFIYNSSYKGEWVKLSLPNAIYLESIKIYRMNNTATYSRAPWKYKIYGTNVVNDSPTDWVELFENSSGATYPSNNCQIDTISSTVPYKKYAICVNMIVGGTNGDMLNFAEWELYGAEQSVVRKVIISTEERQYPPSELTGGTIVSNTITKTPTGTPAYGAGNYIVSWSSYNLYNGDLLFDYVSGSTGIGWISTDGNYNTTSGTSTATSTYIGTDSANHGQWIKIKLPVPICLTRVELYARQLAGWQFRNPLRYVVYGSDDNGENWTILINNTSVDVTYTSYMTTSSTVNGFSEMYSYFAFAFTKIGTSNIGDCGFNEIKLFGKEEKWLGGGGGGGGGVGSIGVSSTSSLLTPSGGNGFVVPIRTTGELFAGGGGANGGTRVPASGYTFGYGGNSSSSAAGNGGNGVVIVRWKSLNIIQKLYTPDGIFEYIRFTNNGTINFNKNTECDVLIVGGGGGGSGSRGSIGGGNGIGNIGGGGGGGNLIYASKWLARAGTYNAVVGKGGRSSEDGRVSSVFGLIANGGKGAINENGGVANVANTISNSGVTENTVIENKVSFMGGSGNNKGEYSHSMIRKYPPANMSSANSATSHTQSLTASYGSGVYNVSSSSYYADGTCPVSTYFNGVLSGENGGGSMIDSYIQTSGLHNDVLYPNNFIVNDYKGEWVKLSLPVSIYLSYVKFYRRPDVISRAAKAYRIYGSVDNVNWIQLLDEPNATYPASNLHVSSTIYTFKAYNYFAICVSATSGGDANSTMLELCEIEFYGEEQIVTVKKYPPAPLANNADGVDNTKSKVLTGQLYGNGTYLINWSSDYGSWRPSHVFSGVYPDSAGGHSDFNAYSIVAGNTLGKALNTSRYIGNDVVNYGEWITLTIPNRIYLSYIKLYQRNGQLVRSPKSYVIYGTNDSVSWDNLIDVDNAVYQSLVHTSPTIFPKAYAKYAIVIRQIFGSTDAAAGANYNFDEWELYGQETTVTKYPRENMSNYSKTYTNGTVVTVSASTQYNNTDHTAYSSFSGNTGDYGWGSPGNTYNTTTGTAVTTYLTGYPGEWLKIDLGESIILESFTIYPRVGYNNRMPRTFRLYASTDASAYTNGVNDAKWNLIYTYADTNTTKDANPIFCAISNNISYYRYYFIVINQIYSGTSIMQFAELELFGSKIHTNLPRITDRFFYDITDMVAWYSFMDNFNDRSGNGRHLTNFGSTIDYTNAIVGKGCVSLSGVSQYLQMPATNFSVFDGLTFSTWVYFTETNRSFERVFDFANGDGNNNIFVTRITTTSSLRAAIWNASTAEIAYNFDNVIVNNTWMHICWTIQKNPVIWNVYINGVLKTPSSSSGTVIWPNNVTLANCYIGKSGWSGDSYFKGLIDDFRIYKKTLSANYIYVLSSQSYRKGIIGGGSGGSVISAGINATDILGGGNAVTGFQNSITGTAITYSSGGKGATNGEIEIQNTNYGDGGNGTITESGNDGGSGVVIIRWKSDSTISPQYSLHTQGNIWMDGSSIVWTSDERIKKEIYDIQDDDALQKILSLQPKKYQYIDNMTKTSEEVYGFISQQVKEVIPEATDSVVSFVPNIYQTCHYTNVTNDITGLFESAISLPEGFDISKLSYGFNNSNISTRVKLLNNNNEPLIVDYILSEINGNYQMVVENTNVFDNDDSNIFVYGTEVYDLTTIDKSYLFTLNICANQELNRKVKILEENNSNMMLKISTLESELYSLEQKLL